MTLRHHCPSDGCYKDRLPDWGILDGCFPRGIRPSDVDGIVEINEHVLMLEWKPRLGVLTRGQLLMFRNITRGSPKVQALIVYGDRGQPSEIELWQGGAKRFRQACDIEFLRWFCHSWAVFADSRPSLPAAPEPWMERRRFQRRAAHANPVQLLLTPNLRSGMDRRSTNIRIAAR